MLRWLLAVLFVFLLSPGVLFAQSPPPGSYRDSCENVRVTGPNLRAECRTEAGGRRSTLLPDYALCTTPPFNRNGDLSCNYGPVPAGSYRDSCRNARLKEGALIAWCKNRRGEELETEIRFFEACASTIFNSNGRLMCTFPGTKPNGSYQQSCINIRPYTDASGNKRVSAKCRRMSQAPVYDDIAYDDCRGPISNRDGRLDCRRQSLNFPEGSYLRTCRFVRSNTTQIKAECRTTRGRWETTQLNDWPGCLGDIFNQNGVLRCARTLVSDGTTGNMQMDGPRPARIICKTNSIPADFVPTSDTNQGSGECDVAGTVWDYWIVSDTLNQRSGAQLIVCPGYEPRVPSGWTERGRLKSGLCKTFADQFPNEDYDSIDFRKD